MRQRHPHPILPQVGEFTTQLIRSICKSPETPRRIQSRVPLHRAEKLDRGFHIEISVVEVFDGAAPVTYWAFPVKPVHFKLQIVTL